MKANLYLCTGVVSAEEFIVAVLAADGHYTATQKFPETCGPMVRALNVTWVGICDIEGHFDSLKYQKDGVLVMGHYHPCSAQLEAL